MTSMVRPLGDHLGARDRTAHPVDERPVVELHARHVHVHPEAVADEHVVLPRREALGRLVQHPVVDLLDEAALLGERDDPVGPEQALGRVAPAQQGLEPRQVPVGEVEDRLVAQLQLAVGRSPAPGRCPTPAARAPRSVDSMSCMLIVRGRPPQGHLDPFA